MFNCWCYYNIIFANSCCNSPGLVENGEEESEQLTGEAFQLSLEQSTGVKLNQRQSGTPLSGVAFFSTSRLVHSSCCSSLLTWT